MVNKYENYIDTELDKIVGPAGPTAFPYKGTWAAGRHYDGLDVVEFSGMLYIAVAGHTATSVNAPGASETEWAPLQIAALSSQDVENMIQGQPHTFWAYSGDGNAELTKGSIRCHNDGMDIKVIGLPYAYDKEQFSIYGARLVHWRHFPNVTENDGWVSQNSWTPDSDTGWQSISPSIPGRWGCYYRKKNGFVTFKISGFPDTSQSLRIDNFITLPEDLQTSNLNFLGVIIRGDNSRFIVDLAIANRALLIDLRLDTWGPDAVLFSTVTYPV